MCENVFENLIISLDEFNTYTGDYEDSVEVKGQKARTLATAQQIVEEYLGYHVLSCDHTEVISGVDQRKVFLHSLPVTFVYDVSVNGYELSSGFGYVNDHDSIYLDKKPCPKDEIKVHYAAGFSRNNVPAVIRQTILRIATLLYTEGSENIAVSSKSYADGSRSFMNYNSFDKFLKPLRSLKSTWV